MPVLSLDANQLWDSQHIKTYFKSSDLKHNIYTYIYSVLSYAAFQSDIRYVRMGFAKLQNNVVFRFSSLKNWISKSPTLKIPKVCKMCVEAPMAEENILIFARIHQTTVSRPYDTRPQEEWLIPRYQLANAKPLDGSLYLLWTQMSHSSDGKPEQSPTAPNTKK